MKNWYFLILALIFSMALAAGSVAAKTEPQPDLQLSSEWSMPVESSGEDLSPPAEQAIWAEIQTNLKALHSQEKLDAPNAVQAVTYELPLRMAPGLPDYAGYIVSAYADHDPASGSIRDYTGGTRTYDGHHGTDYGLYPFKWNKVNAGEMQVVAAAAGKIVIKDNATPADHSCAAGGAVGGGNLIALEHADGRVTLYAHMRYNSLTSKGIGESVAQGEYLGLVASSGGSNGPHLHFEVRAANGSMEWIDPYAGTYSQTQSLWASQRPYWDSGILKLVTLSTVPAFNNCAPEPITNQDSYTQPSVIYFYTFFRDYQHTLPVVLNIYRPDGTLRRTWSYTDNNNYPAMYLKWTVDFNPNEPAGTWRFEAIYGGQTYQTFFNINAPPTLTVNSPNGSEQWDILLGHSITWADNFGGAVNLALYQNGVFLANLATNTPSDGEYLWVPGRGLAPGAGYSIRVTSVINPALYDESDASFSLTPTTLTKSLYLPMLQH